ncbi:MAG: PilX N-terminal domain-containing pilus assembly protein [Bacillota bacterium]
MSDGANSRGGALVSVLLVLTIIITLGTALLTLSASEAQIASNQAKGIKAFYLAEAGLKLGISELINNSNLRGTVVGSTPLGEGRIVSVTVTDQGTYLLMRSTGEVGGVRRVVSSKVQASPFLQGLVIKSDYSTNEELVLTGGAVITGNLVFGQNLNIISSSVTINGNVTTGGYVKNSGKIYGNVIAGGSITNTGLITGTRTPNADVRITPVVQVDLPYYQSVAKMFINGNASWTVQQLQALVNQNIPHGKKNVIIVYGNVTLTNSARVKYSGQAMVVATGDILIDGTLEANSLLTDAWGFATPQTIRVKSLGYGAIEGVFHANQAFQTTTGGVVVRGGIVSNYLNLASNPSITIIPELASNLFPILQSNQVFTVFDWVEGPS